MGIAIEIEKCLGNLASAVVSLLGVDGNRASVAVSANAIAADIVDDPLQDIEFIKKHKNVMIELFKNHGIEAGNFFEELEELKAQLLEKKSN